MYKYLCHAYSVIACIVRVISYDRYMGKGGSWHQLLRPPCPLPKDPGLKQEERAEAVNVHTGIRSVYAP